MGQPRDEEQERMAYDEGMRAIITGAGAFINSLNEVISDSDRLVMHYMIVESLYRAYPEEMDRMASKAHMIIKRKPDGILDQLINVARAAIRCRLEENKSGQIAMIDLEMLEQMGEVQARIMLPDDFVDQIINQGMWPWGGKR